MDRDESQPLVVQLRQAARTATRRRRPGRRPVGTCVTGTIALAARSHAGALQAASVVLYGLLVLAWVVVASRTVSGAASGRLFGPQAAISRALST